MRTPYSIPIVGHVTLDHCWLCRGVDGLHEHHVIPRAYGGTDGPQVTLCGAHHTLVHSTAVGKQDASNVYQQGDFAEKARFAYLVQVIRTARERDKYNRKPIQLNQTLDPDRAQKLRIIKNASNLSSIDKTLEYIIDVVYRQIAPLQPPKR